MPACGYALSENVQWTIPATSPITETADPYVLTVISTDGLAHHGVNTVIVKDTVLYESDVWEPSITFDITITDPCRTSTITAITLSSMTVVLGEEELQSFVEAVDSAGTTYGSTVCGTRLYEIYDISSDTITEVATVIDNGSGNYEIRAFSENEDNEGSHNLRLKVTFVDYPLADSETFPEATTNFFLTVNQATCDCTLITWDNPALLTLETGLMTSPADTLPFLKAEANEASKDASPAIRACYRNNGSCPTSSTIVVVDDDTAVLDTAFMEFSSNTLTVTPTISSQIKTYNMRVTQTTSISSDFSWVGATVTVTCTITRIDVPAVPTETTYLINSGALNIGLTPEFLQYPPCDYVLNELLLWNFDPSPAPVYPDGDNQYNIRLETDDLSKARV